jgi:hypothetical protein
LKEYKKIKENALNIREENVLSVGILNVMGHLISTILAKKNLE